MLELFVLFDAFLLNIMTDYTVERRRGTNSHNATGSEGLSFNSAFGADKELDNVLENFL